MFLISSVSMSNTSVWYTEVSKKVCLIEIEDIFYCLLQTSIMPDTAVISQTAYKGPWLKIHSLK